MTDFLHGFDDSDWAYFVRGHDERELRQIDELEALRWEKLWMHEIPASQAEDYGISDPDCDDTVLRNPETGRFEARMIWVECPPNAAGAVPWIRSELCLTIPSGHLKSWW